MKLVYKKKIKSLKNDIKAFKITAKDLEASEQQRNDLLSEFEKYKTMIQTEQNKLLSDHSQQMKRLDELSLHKLVIYFIFYHIELSFIYRLLILLIIFLNYYYILC